MKKKVEKCNGWKVLLASRRSVSDWCRANKYALLYEPNKRVVPTLKGSKLFFFKEREDADAFAKFSFTNIIVPCIAENPVEISTIVENCEDIIKFWKKTANKSNKRKYKYLDLSAPTGSYVADAITCLE
jgi:hypothetical protein